MTIKVTHFHSRKLAVTKLLNAGLLFHWDFLSWGRATLNILSHTSCLLRCSTLF